MKVNKYKPFAFIYFFINAVGLPFGLLYTILLTPFFYLWVRLKGKRHVAFKFIVVAAPFIVAHLVNGVDIFQYFRSVVLYFTVYVFCYAFYTLATTYDHLANLFRWLMITNFLFTLVSIVLLLTPLRSLFWMDWSIEIGRLSVTNWPRLTMLTYEPSYYGTLLAPIFAFFFIKFILRTLGKQATVTLIMVTLPLLLSLSLGVISALTLAIGIFFIINFRRFVTSKRMFYSIMGIVLVAFTGLLILVLFFPENPIFVRLTAIMAGADGSAKGRTFEALGLGYKIAEQKSILFGVGPGQLKIIGSSIIKEYYNYPADFGQVSIPNAAAETFAIFGVVGLLIRISLEVYLFFKTRVIDNYYRTLLFFFIFIYQFTGSFTTNIAEYVIWILAFTNAFPEFDRKTGGVEIKVSDQPAV